MEVSQITEIWWAVLLGSKEETVKTSIWEFFFFFFLASCRKLFDVTYIQFHLSTILYLYLDDPKKATRLITHKRGESYERKSKELIVPNN